MTGIGHSDLTGRQLEVFLAVHDTGSLSKAAQQLHINQSTVSHHLEKLRDSFGDPLFVRTGRQIKATDKARRLAPQVRDILIALEALCEEGNYEPSKDLAPVTIAGNIDGFYEVFSTVRAEFRSAAPNLTIRFRELGSYMNIEGTFDDGLSDIILCVRVQQHPKSVAWETILSDDIVCFYDPDFRSPITTIEDYVDAEHAVIDFGTSGTSIVQGTLNKYDVERKITTYAPSFAILADLVRGTNLVMTMRKGYQHTIFSKLAWCEAPITFPKVNLDMVWHKRQGSSKRNQWIRQRITDSLTKLQPNDA